MPGLAWSFALALNPALGGRGISVSARLKTSRPAGLASGIAASSGLNRRRGGVRPRQTHRRSGPPLGWLRLETRTALREPSVRASDTIRALRTGGCSFAAVFWGSLPVRGLPHCPTSGGTLRAGVDPPLAHRSTAGEPSLRPTSAARPTTPGRGSSVATQANAGLGVRPHAEPSAPGRSSPVVAQATEPRRESFGDSPEHPSRCEPCDAARLGSSGDGGAGTWGGAGAATWGGRAPRRRSRSPEPLIDPSVSITVPASGLREHPRGRGVGRSGSPSVERRRRSRDLGVGGSSGRRRRRDGGTTRSTG